MEHVFFFFLYWFVKYHLNIRSTVMNRTFWKKSKTRNNSPPPLPVLSAFTEKRNVSIFSTGLWSLRKAMLFRYECRLVTISQKCHFYLCSLHFSLPFGLVFYAQLRILKFQDSVYQKADLWTQTINEWRKWKHSVVL